jgi:hypothetical protein
VGVDGFNRIPPQCDGICNLTQAEVDIHGIVVSRNCLGPRLGEEGDLYDDSTKVVSGEVVEIDETGGSSAGRLACRNAGVNMWLDNRKEVFRERTTAE